MRIVDVDQLPEHLSPLVDLHARVVVSGNFATPHVLLDAVLRVPEEVWGGATLNVFGGNLEFQPEAFRAQFGQLMERAGRRARFHGNTAPTAMAPISGTASGSRAVLKKGGPTEIFCPSSRSANIG